MIKVGCCGFPIKKERYYSEFKVVEVQKTFYDPRNIETFKKWRVNAPDDFEFTIKAWQGVTHDIKSPTWKRYKGELIGKKERYGLLHFTEEVMWAWERTLDAANALNSNIIVVQLPPKLSWDENNEDIKKTIDYLLESKKIIVIEPRNKTWFREEVYDYFRKNNIVFCTDPFKNGLIDTHRDVMYLRLHGIGGYKYKYNEEELKALYTWVEPYLDQRKIYVMFNNVYMYENAKQFLDMLG